MAAIAQLDALARSLPETTMRVRSLSFRTDLFFPAFDGSIVDRGEYLVVTTPTNPTYHWGNFVLFPGPPRAGDLARWTEAFRREIGEPEQVGHAAFGIDGVDGDGGEVQPFLDAGFELERGVVLTARAVRPPPRPNPDVTVRPLAGDADWEMAVQHGPTALESDEHDEGFVAFHRRQMARYRAMAEAGRGHWFGAFSGGALVADLGLFHQDGVGRYQSVVTHPEHRGRGIASTMVHAAAEHVLRHDGVRKLVIVADEGSQAARIYASVGFVPVETTLGLARSTP
ncbi:MAG: GNAT family N-acetyltransferase [Trueperaceae bacterium]